MDFASNHTLQTILSRGEKILWSGRPMQGLRFRTSDILLIPFSLLWGGFAFVWEYMAFSAGAPAFFLLFGGVFVLIGLHLIFGRFLYDALKRKNAYYGVTNERVLIVSEFPFYRLESIDLRNLSDMTLSSHAGGHGNITFGPQHSSSFALGNAAWPGAGFYQDRMFQFLEDARPVYETIRDAQKKLHSD